ncbi:MAG TPA: SUMF1/EgtB/PvdO family nonheme iron enzyme [Polyangiaceae bacterium]
MPTPSSSGPPPAPLASSDSPPAAEPSTPPSPPPSACPAGMAHVSSNYCPDVERVCLDKEYDKPNHITICNRYAHEKPKCRAPREALDFCIDEYEYPNQKGAHPPVMLNYFQASELCGAQGKRLCGEGEWVASCEGPDEMPFPYGYERSAEKCNFDNRWVDPDLKRVYSKDPEIQRAELARLDRSVPSGAKAACVSGFGVFDLTGNVDEWVHADHDRPREHARFAGLKGGAWGHVRNACRPVTTSHPPDFQYYFIGLRCCRDVASATSPEQATR